MNIVFGGQDFFLHASGALYWPREKMLIVSDMHLEKGSHFAIKGFFLPPYDSRDSLRLLSDVVQDTGCTRLLLLGDAFHDAKGYARLPAVDKAAFDALIALTPIWIRGNHDGDFVPDGFMGMDSFTHHGVTFRHEAHADGIYEISGHYHPKADIVFRGTRVSRPCFVEDGERLILPAFGAYTGGLSASMPLIRGLFRGEPRHYILGKSRVLPIPA